jgi:hypothetical protein
MGIGVFTEKKKQPTEAQVTEALGSKLPVWQDLIRLIREKYPVQEDFKFMYGQNYGWGLKFSIKKQLLTCLYPAEECFFAQINLSPEAIEQALRMSLGVNVQDAIEHAHPYPEGRWLFVRVASEADASAVRQLLAMRVEERRLVNG